MKTNKEISKAEKTRLFIIEKAAPIFNKKGYDGTSLSDLISATGLTKGAIYGNFKNKDEVALEAFEYNLSLVRDVIFLPSSQGENAVSILLKIPEFYRKSFGKIAKQGGCPLLNASVDADDTNSTLYKRVYQSVKNWKTSIEKIILTGQARKQIKKNINAAEYAAMIIALIEGGIMLTKSLQDPAQFIIILSKIEKMIKEEMAI